jgi:PPM family protein phosphatase
MIYQFCSRTDTGQARDNNEDSVAYDEEARVAVLADGMGGYNAGEVASGMATAFINLEMARWLNEASESAKPRDIRRAMEICVDNANLSIFNAAHANPQYSGMGTTLVMGIFRPGVAQIGHIGDSRCYRLRGSQLEQITRDHSLLQEQLDAGLLTAEQARHSNIKNLVTRAMGVEDTVLLDINEFQVELGDVFLMCSDGLSDMVDDAGIAKILCTQSGLAHKAEMLVDAANDQGGRDNISVLLVEACEAPEKRGLIARLLGK